MKAKKTFKVAELVTIVNVRNKLSTCEPEVRRGWNALLEIVLHETGNYEGFGFLNSTLVPPGHKPGITTDPETGAHTFPDETRRYYN